MYYAAQIYFQDSKLMKELQEEKYTPPKPTKEGEETVVEKDQCYTTYSTPDSLPKKVSGK